MAEWHGRLRELLDKRGWTVVELAKRTGVPEQSLYKYIQGRIDVPRGDALSRIAEALGTTELFLSHGIADKTLVNNALATRLLPVINLTHWAGGADVDLRTMVEGAVKSVPVPSDAAGPDAFACLVQDNAMNALPRGSYVVVDPDQSAEPGRYVLAWSAAARRAVVRRWRALDLHGAGVLLADSPDYPPIPLADASDGRVVGRVVLLISPL